MLRSHVASAFACCTKHAPFVVNCCSAVSLIFVNKYLLQVCKFHFLGLLGALHMGITALLAVQQSQLDTSTAALSVLEVAFFTVVTLVSLVSMNLSLLVNHVGVYQISKIAMIPACCFLEFVLQRKRVTKYGAAAICVLIIGVIIACAPVFRSCLAHKLVSADAKRTDAWIRLLTARYLTSLPRGPGR